MNKKQVIEILKKAFSHYIFEEDIIIDKNRVLLCFPSIGVVITEVEEFNPGFINITLAEENNDIGIIINDILLDAEFMSMRTPNKF